MNLRNERELQESAAGRCARGNNGRELEDRNGSMFWTTLRRRNYQGTDEEQDWDNNRPKQACTDQTDCGAEDGQHCDQCDEFA